MNIDAIKSKLSTLDWSYIFTGNLTVDEMTQVFYRHLYEIIENNVPKITLTNKNFPPWFDSSLKQAVALKKKLHSLYKESPSEFTYNEFSTQRALCKKLANTRHHEYLRNIESQIKINPKKFWDFVDIKNSKNRNIPDSVYLDSVKAETGDEIANLFAQHFEKYTLLYHQLLLTLAFFHKSIIRIFQIFPL